MNVKGAGGHCRLEEGVTVKLCGERGVEVWDVLISSRNNPDAWLVDATRDKWHSRKVKSMLNIVFELEEQATRSKKDDHSHVTVDIFPFFFQVVDLFCHARRR